MFFSELEKKCVIKGPGLFCSNPYTRLAHGSMSLATLLLISLLRFLLSLLVPFQSLLGWTRKVKHLEVDCFPVAHHSHRDGISSILPGDTGWGETGRNDMFRGEELGGAGLSSTGWISVKSAVVSVATFCLPFHGHTAHILSAYYYLRR